MHLVRDHVLSPEQCNQLITNYDSLDNYIEATTYARAEDNKSRNNTFGYGYDFSGNYVVKDDNIRASLIHWVNPIDLINKALYGFMLEANTHFFDYNISDHEPVQFTKYQAGGVFSWHYDTYTRDQIENNRQRKLTASLLLSDPNEYEGGVLEFFNGKDAPITTSQDQGTIVIFDSSDWHRITKITKGIRHSFVMWAVGAKFR